MTYIAVVDDHVMVRKGLCALINSFSTYKVLFDSSNGQEFINGLKSQLPDIVLLDINMPVMDGYSTASWIRVNHPDIKVLALSTMDSESAIIKIISNGAHGYIQKDADTDELKEAFHDVMTKGYHYNDLVTRKVMKSIHALAAPDSQVNIFAKLTTRETDFIKLACSEKTYADIAAEMFVSERTVDGYREAVFRKLNVTTRVGLVIYAIKNNLVTP